LVLSRTEVKVGVTRNCGFPRGRPGCLDHKGRG
jgi:hypothetical protein